MNKINKQIIAQLSSFSDNENIWGDNQQLIKFINKFISPSMYADFFKNERGRPNNPTYISNHVQSTMLFPGLRYSIQKSKELDNPRPHPRPHEEPAIARQDRPVHTRTRSHLSNYGSSSLGKLPVVSDRDVFENQQKKFNIITLNDNEYKQSIKVFPKFHNEIKADAPHQTRQALIKGKPELALRKSTLMDKIPNPEQERPKQKITPKITEKIK